MLHFFGGKRPTLPKISGRKGTTRCHREKRREKLRCFTNFVSYFLDLLSERYMNKLESNIYEVLVFWTGEALLKLISAGVMVKTVPHKNQAYVLWW